MNRFRSLVAAAVLSLTAFAGAFAEEKLPDAARAELELSQAAFAKKDWPAVLEHAQKAAELAPRSLEAQQRYISMHRFVTLQTMDRKVAEGKQLELSEQYKREARREAKNPFWQLLIGAALYYEDPEQSERAYKRAVALDPTNGEALSSLGGIATTRGDDAAARAYYIRAAKADPDNPRYLGHYVGSFMNEDFGRFREEAMKLIERFPTSADAVKWYYWLGTRSPDAEQKRRYLQEGIDRYPVSSATKEQLGWLGSVYSGYFELLQSEDPAAAEAFALETMHRFDGKSAEKSWFERYRRQSDLNVVRAARAAGDFKSGLEIIERLEKELSPRDRLREQVLYEKALAQSGTGEHAAALETLLGILKSSASPVAEAAFYDIAKKAGKTEAEADEQLWTARLAGAEPFKDFTLPDPDGKKITLSDLRGQVLLVNFWYPSCGPCRGEFPHLQRIVERFKDRPFKVLALNTHPREADKVKPFLQKNNYDFVALQTPGEQWTKDTYGVIGTPANFLIDAEGRVVAQPRLHDLETETRLSLLIEQLLKRGS
jgi:peroxiredoxin/Tfp pilus assembly protein PilF